MSHERGAKEPKDQTTLGGHFLLTLIGIPAAVIAGVIYTAIALGVLHIGQTPTKPNPTGTTSPSRPTDTRGGLSHPVYLDTLPELTEASFTTGQVTIGSDTYSHGVQFSVGFISSEVAASFNIPTGAKTFSVVIGNDQDQPNDMGQQIPLFYEVLIDGSRRASGHVKGPSHDGPLKVDVTGGSTITLQVTNMGDVPGGTHADWGNPVFR